VSIVKVDNVQGCQIMVSILTPWLDTTMNEKNAAESIYARRVFLLNTIRDTELRIFPGLTRVCFAARRVFGPRMMTPTELPQIDKTPNDRRLRVVIVERQLLHYRVPFYNHLRSLLLAEGIELQLLIGEGTAIEKKRKDEVAVPWATSIDTRYFLGGMLCWQPFREYARNADLVIVMHENKMIFNLWLTFFERPRKIAFWGHGANLQSPRPNGLKEKFKRWTVGKVDWWFAYTESSARLVEDAGFPRARITVVENSIDTAELTRDCANVTLEDCRLLRLKLGLGEGQIGVFVGSLYSEKRLPFLLSAACLIRMQIPDFQLLIVGAGPMQAEVEQAAQCCSWIRYLGPLRGKEKAVVLILADVMLNPGLVGLGILDSFVSGRPMFTTDCGVHSPEISYLSNWKNGVVTKMEPRIYAEAVSEVLRHPEMMNILRKGAMSSSSKYTIENMAGRIRDGIFSCLSLR
jgi:glycosyltransferase involved in cell wall biosynthesis